MGIIAKSNGQDFENELLPAGSHVALCYAMVDLGTQETEFNGEKSKKRQVRVVWELSDEKKVFDETRGEEPMIAGKNFTLSMHEKAGLRKFMENWRGLKYTEQQAEAVDITTMLGKACLLSISHGTNEKSGKEYAQINSASLLPKSMPKPTPHNKPYFFSLDEFEQEVYDKLPKWLQEKIALSEEYKAIAGSQGKQEKEPVMAEEESDDSDLPF
ncbi:hypothetical protein MUK70_11660 [Dyadobacter chenwenxiniae]|uniref:Phage protein n=1 Tax=Dyadobacter chenwenxiniae TaxID=2906456 RepID=A0A9X1PEZ7_9BACT|nr:hypothetical protein [Dyadobacter chenwenxiniae]MCF0059897.1 hypothetical protein [Dyadobacter chenwenxiniae]UON85636.1 hypothetical protein MUK70_11660 [Dyadobacter chenwenxiniae]